MKKTLALALATSAIIAPTAASYDNHGWWWNPSKMENAITDEGLPWMDSKHEVTDANCRGLKPAWRNKGTLLYKSFNCVVTTEPLGGDASGGYFTYTYTVRAYVLGQYKWTAVKLKTQGAGQ